MILRPLILIFGTWYSVDATGNYKVAIIPLIIGITLFFE